MVAGHTPSIISLPQEAVIMSKVTISLPEKLLQALDEFALNRNTTRSGAVAELIRKMEKENLEAELTSGYMELAELNLNQIAAPLRNPEEIYDGWEDPEADKAYAELWW
jgi:CopG family transcriptional regulator/antitoxin EndoAI